MIEPVPVVSSYAAGRLTGGPLVSSNQRPPHFFAKRAIGPPQARSRDWWRWFFARPASPPFPFQHFQHQRFKQNAFISAIYLDDYARAGCVAVAEMMPDVRRLILTCSKGIDARDRACGGSDGTLCEKVAWPLIATNQRTTRETASRYTLTDFPSIMWLVLRRLSRVPHRSAIKRGMGSL